MPTGRVTSHHVVGSNNYLLDRYDPSCPKGIGELHVGDSTFCGIEVAQVRESDAPTTHLSFRLGTRFSNALDHTLGRNAPYADVLEFYQGVEMKRLLQASGGWKAPYRHWPLTGWDPQFAATLLAAEMRSFVYEGGQAQWDGIAILPLPGYATEWRHMGYTSTPYFRIPHVIELIDEAGFYEAAESNDFLVSPSVPLISLFENNVRHAWYDPLRPWGSLGGWSLHSDISTVQKDIGAMQSQGLWPAEGRVMILTDEVWVHDYPLITDLKREYPQLSFEMISAADIDRKLIGDPLFGNDQRSPVIVMAQADGNRLNQRELLIQAIRSGYTPVLGRGYK